MPGVLPHESIDVWTTFVTGPRTRQWAAYCFCSPYRSTYSEAQQRRQLHEHPGVVSRFRPQQDRAQVRPSYSCTEVKEQLSHSKHENQGINQATNAAAPHNQLSSGRADRSAQGAVGSRALWIPAILWRAAGTGGRKRSRPAEATGGDCRASQRGE